jgi:hypothetical protein
VLNGGVLRTAPFRILPSRRDGINLDPDVVLWFRVGNDCGSQELFDSLQRPTIDVEDGQLRANEFFPSARYDKQERFLRTATLQLRAFFASNSALYVFLRERFSETLWRLGLRNNPPPPDFCAKVMSPSMEKGWAVTQKVPADENSVRPEYPGSKTLPTQYQVHEDLWTHHVTTFQLESGGYDLEKPQALLKTLHEGESLVDVLPAMRAAARDERLFYPIASYMTPSGHALVARVVSEYLAGTSPSTMRKGGAGDRTDGCPQPKTRRCACQALPRIAHRNSHRREVLVRLTVPVRNVGPTFSEYDPAYGKRPKKSFVHARRR